MAGVLSLLHFSLNNFEESATIKQTQKESHLTLMVIDVRNESQSVCNSALTWTKNLDPGPAF